MVRFTVFTIRLGLLVFPLVVLGQAVNSSPSSSFPSNATPITTHSPPATAPGQAIEQIVPAEDVGAPWQSTNPSAIAVAQAATAPAPTATLSDLTGFTASYTPGFTDVHGVYNGGTEVRFFVDWKPHTINAKLYAGIGYLFDDPGPEGRQSSEIVVLNKAGGAWETDVDLGAFCPPGYHGCQIYPSYGQLWHFTKDAGGNAVSRDIIVVGTWYSANQAIMLYERNPLDKTRPPQLTATGGPWYQQQIAAYPVGTQSTSQIRAFGAPHTDTVTRAQIAFLGETPHGVFTCQLVADLAAGEAPLACTHGVGNEEFNISTDYTGPPCGSTAGQNSH